MCNNRPVRQDLLDRLVWSEVIKLLEHPELIAAEIERRLAAARESNPNKRREEALRRDLTRTRKSMERLVTAYQETLLSLEELRARLPELRRRKQASQAELQSIVDQTNNRAAYLRLTETLSRRCRLLCGARRSAATSTAGGRRDDDEQSDQNSTAEKRFRGHAWIPYFFVIGSLWRV